MHRCLTLVFVLLCTGCIEGESIEPLRPMTEEPSAPLSAEQAATRFAEMCASCHGEIGEGGLGPRLIDLEGTHRELVDTIDLSMPANDATTCVDECAEGLATFIEERLTSSALRCDEVLPSPRRLRALNRREYVNSVSDLLGLRPGDSAPLPSCEPTTFRYDPMGAAVGSVSVAGSFNDWDAAAWPMRLSDGAWSLTRALPVGTHAYKFVIDGGRWIADPSNPDGVDDGLGGRNSQLTVDCMSGMPAVDSDGVDLSADLPVEARPEGYLFDNSADALSVTSVHLDEYLLAGERALEALGDGGVGELVGCGAGRAACAPGFVRDFGRRAFRRPLTETEAERYEALADEAPDDAAGYRAVLLGMLVSPSFLYRSELGEPLSDGTYRLTGYEIATAISYGILGTTPSASLLDAAERGELDDAPGIASQAEAMLEDPRARTVLAAFGRQWLGIEGVPEATKADPAYDGGLGRAMLQETEAFFLHVVFDSTGRFDELLTADFSFVNERLARVYGIDGVGGDELRRTDYPDGRRAGLLGHGSVLSATAHSDQSSPIRRGLFVRQRILCQEFPPPPPSAGGVPDVDPEATTRDRFAQHTDNETCAGCHQYIDPIGFGFESFGPIGAWRDDENGRAIERGGNMVDVEYLGAETDAPFRDLTELGEVLSASEAAPACFARQAYRFVRGARETINERCAVEYVNERFEESGGDVRTLLIATFTAPDFRLRRQP